MIPPYVCSKIGKAVGCSWCEKMAWQEVEMTWCCGCILPNWDVLIQIGTCTTAFPCGILKPKKLSTWLEFNLRCALLPLLVCWPLSAGISWIPWWTRIASTLHYVRRDVPRGKVLPLWHSGHRKLPWKQLGSVMHFGSCLNIAQMRGAREKIAVCMHECSYADSSSVVRLHLTPINSHALV